MAPGRAKTCRWEKPCKNILAIKTLKKMCLTIFYLCILWASHQSIFNSKWIHPTHPKSDMYFNTILPCLARSSKLCLPFRFSKQKSSTHFSFLLMYAWSSSHLPWCYYLNNIWWGVKIMNLFIMKLAASFYHLLPVISQYLCQHSVIKCSCSVFFPHCDEPGFLLTQNKVQLQNCIFWSLDLYIADEKTKGSELN